MSAVNDEVAVVDLVTDGVDILMPSDDPKVQFGTAKHLRSIVSLHGVSLPLEGESNCFRTWFPSSAGGLEGAKDGVHAAVHTPRDAEKEEGEKKRKDAEEAATMTPEEALRKQYLFLHEVDQDVTGRGVDYRFQGDPLMYSKVNREARNALKRESSIIKAVTLFWKAFKKEEMGPITVNGELVPDYEQSKDVLRPKQFFAFYAKICRVLDRDFDFHACYKQAVKDWDRDTRKWEGKVMTKREFFNSLFEVVDIWTVTTSVEEYLDFLGKLFFRVTEVRTAALKLLTLLERHQVHHLAPLLFKHHIRTTQHFIQLQHSDVEDLFDDDILKTLDTEAYLHHTAKQNVLTRMIACQEEEKQYRERQENRKLRRRGRVFRQLNSINTQYKHLGVKSLDVLDQISEAEKDTMFRCMSSEELKAILNLDLEQVKEMKARVIAKFAAAAADGSESSGEEKESPPTAATAAVLRRRTKDRDDSLMADAITRRVLTERFEREEKARKEKASFLATLESFSSESEPLTSRVANGGQDEVRERRPALRLSPHSPSDASSDSSEEPEAVSPESEEERRAHVRAKEEADRVKAEEREAAKKARAEAHSTALNAKIETLPDGMIQAFAQFKRERRATTRKHRNSIKPKKWFEQQEEELTEEEKKKHTKEENLKEVDSDLLMIMTHLSGNTGEDDVEQPGQGEDGPQHEEDEESDVEFDMAAFMSMNPAQKQKRLIEMKLFAAGHSDWKRHDMGDVPVEAKAPPEPEESEEEEDALNKKKKKRNKKKRDIDVFDDYLQHGGSDEFAYEDEANEVFGTASEVRTARVINERKKSIGRALSKSHRYQSMHPEHEVSASDFHRIPGSLEDRTPRGFGYSGGHFFSQGKAPQRDASTSRSSRAGSWGMRGQSKVPIHVKVPRPLSASIQKSVARLAAPKATRQPRVSTLEGSNFQYEPAFVAVYPDELRLRLEGMFAQQGGNSQAGFDTAVHVLDQRLRGNSDGSRGMQSLNEYMQALSDSHASSLRPEHELTPEQFVVVGASPNKQGRARSVDVTAHQDSLDKSQVTLHRSVGGFASQTFATHIPSHQPAAARPASSSTSSRGSATPRSTAFSIDSTSRNKKALEFRRRRTDMIERLFKNTSETIGVTRARAGKIEFSLQTQTNLNAMFDQLVAERERRLTLLLHGKYKYELLREEGPGSESKITDKRFCVVENGLREKAEVAAATYLDTQRSHPSFMSLLFNESSSSLRHLKSMRVQNMTHSNKHRVGSFAPSASPDYIDVLGAKSSMLSNPPLYSPQKQTERSHSVSRPGSAVALQSARLCKSASNKNHALGNLEIQSLEPTLSQGGSLLTGTRKSLKRCASASRMRQAIVPQLTPSGRVQPQPNSRRRRPQSAVTTTDPTQRMLAAAQQQNKTKQQRRRQTAPRPYTASALRRSSSESRLVRNAGEDRQMRRSSSVARTLKRSDSYVVKSIKYRIQRSQSASTTRTASATATAAHLRRMSLGSEYPTALNVGGKQQQHQQRRPQSAMLTRRRSRDSWALLKEKKKQRPGSAVPGTPRHTVKRLLSNEVKHQYGDALSSNKHDWAYARDQHNSTTMLEHSSKIMETEVHMLEANRRMKKSEMISAEAYAAVQMNPNKKKRALVHKHLHTGREIQKTSLSGWNHHDHQPLTASYSSKHHGHMSKLQFLASRPTAMPIAVENSRVESVDHREERLVDAATKHFTGEARPNAELEHRRGKHVQDNERMKKAKHALETTHTDNVLAGLSGGALSTQSIFAPYSAQERTGGVETDDTLLLIASVLEDQKDHSYATRAFETTACGVTSLIVDDDSEQHDDQKEDLRAARLSQMRVRRELASPRSLLRVQKPGSAPTLRKPLNLWPAGSSNAGDKLQPLPASARQEEGEEEEDLFDYDAIISSALRMAAMPSYSEPQKM